MRSAEDSASHEAVSVKRFESQLAECERQLQNEVEKGEAAAESRAAEARRAAQREQDLEQQLRTADARMTAMDEALAAAHAEAQAQAATARTAERAREELETARRLEAAELTSEIRLAERQAEAAQLVNGTSKAAQERLVGTVGALESNVAERSHELQCLEREHETLQRTHAALAEESAIKTQLLESLGETMRGVGLRTDASISTLGADLASVERSLRAMGDARSAALAELEAVRGEHEACRLQLTALQAALRRTRTRAQTLSPTLAYP